jgi:hypothetical protein
LVLVGYPNNQPMPNQPMLVKTIDPTEPKTKKTNFSGYTTEPKTKKTEKNGFLT